MLFRIANILLGATGTEGAESAISEAANAALNVVKKVVQTIVPILFGIIAAVGVIYGIILGINYAKAEDTQKKEEAKKRLINAIVGFGIAIIAAAIMWILAGSNIWNSLLK